MCCKVLCSSDELSEVRNIDMKLTNGNPEDQISDLRNLSCQLFLKYKGFEEKSLSA